MKTGEFYKCIQSCNGTKFSLKVGDVIKVVKFWFFEGYRYNKYRRGHAAIYLKGGKESQTRFVRNSWKEHFEELNLGL